MYKLIEKTNALGYQKTIYRVIDNTFIPFDPDNSDYQQYLKWLEEGNTPLPAENT